jgi:uncharacterized protein (TIGR03067 family)
MARRAFLFLLLCASGCISYTGDVRRVQGIWRIKESYGEEENQSKAAFDTQLTIDGHLIIADGERAVWRFELNEAVEPREINLSVLSGPEKGAMHRGIYHVKGDQWILTIQKEADRPRPTKFDIGEKGSGLFTILLVRVQ